MKVSTIKKISFSLTSILLVLIGWIILSVTKKNDWIYPQIGTIFQALGNIFTKTNLLALLYTFLRVVLCVIISLTISLLINVLYIRFPSSYAFFSPLISFFKTVPFICISLFIILMFKNIWAVYVIGCIMLVPICSEGIKSGIDNFNNNLLDDVKMLPIPFYRKVFSCFIPLILPNILLVIFQSLGLGFKVMIMAEYFLQFKQSVGVIVYQAKVNLEMADIIAWSIVIVVIVVVIELIIKSISSKLIYKYE